MAQSKKTWQKMRSGGDAGWYAAYLRSQHWRRLRKEALRSAGYRCQMCGYVDSSQDKRKGTRLQVHHVSYANVGAERWSDVRVLCWRCHKKEHGR